MQTIPTIQTAPTMLDLSAALREIAPDFVPMYEFCVVSQQFPHILPCDQHGRSPLHYAITFRCSEVLQYYLQNQFYAVNGADTLGDTPLLHAIKMYRSNEPDITHTMICLLLQHGADPNIRHGEAPSALMLATLTEDPVLVELLLACGADPNCRLGADGLLFRAGDTALSLAVRQNDFTRSGYTKPQLDCVVSLMQHTRVPITPNTLFHALQQTKNPLMKSYIMSICT